MIQATELEPNFKFDVMAHEAACNITACFICGTCTAGCPMHAVYPEHDPRKIVRMVNFGMKERVLSESYFWLCSDCYICEQCCPQNVKFSNIFDVLRNMAVKEGYLPPLSINKDICSGCGICVVSCPYSAIELRIQNESAVAHLIAPLCRGCGVCDAACPSGAISIKLFEKEKILGQIEEFLAPYNREG